MHLSKAEDDAAQQPDTQQASVLKAPAWKSFSRCHGLAGEHFALPHRSLQTGAGYHTHSESAPCVQR